MESAYFLVVHLAVFAAVLFLDRKRWRGYALLGPLAMLLDLVFEAYPLSIGIWTYHALPKVAGLSLFAWLMYIPYLGFCYFAANRLVKHV